MMNPTMRSIGRVAKGRVCSMTTVLQRSNLSGSRSFSTLKASSLSLYSSSSSSPALRLQHTQRAHYHERVIDHYENPRNVGSLDKNDPNVGTGLVGAPACGDVMKLQIKFSDEGDVLDAKFKTFGCGSAIASSSYATDWLHGKTIDEAAKVQNKDIAGHLNLPPVKLHCSMLAEDAIKAAIQDFKAKQEKKNGGASEKEAEAEGKKMEE